MRAFLMPGQGTLRVGMGRWLRSQPAGARVFAAAREVLGLDVGELCGRGPQRTLVATENAQPVVTVCNMAAVEVLHEHDLYPDVIAGHSVGELAALYAAGALGLEDTLLLVAARAKAMAAVPDVGAMCAIIGLDVDAVETLTMRATAPGEPVVVALDNGPDNVVVSGNSAAVQRLQDIAGAAGARRMTPLDVSNAFHSPLMAPAGEHWAAALEATPLRAPHSPVVPNVTASPTTDPDLLTAALMAQLTARVRWAETVRSLAAMGVTECVEAGDSKVLCGLVRSGAPDLRTAVVADRVVSARRVAVGANR